MYDIKRLEVAEQQPHQPQQKHNNNSSKPTAVNSSNGSYCERLSFATAAAKAPFQLTCSVITTPAPTALKLTTTAATTTAATAPTTTTTQPAHAFFSNNYKTVSSRDPAETTHMMLLTLRRRRMFQRRACLLSILAAFVFGLALGVFVPMFGLPEYLSNGLEHPSTGEQLQALHMERALTHAVNLSQQQQHTTLKRPPSDFPTIYETTGENTPYTVSFIKEPKEVELSAEQVFRNAFHLEQDRNVPDMMIVKKLDTSDGSIKEFHVQRTANGRFLKGPERRLSKPTLVEQLLHPSSDAESAHPLSGINFVPLAQRIAVSSRSQRNRGMIIKSEIYWGDLVERALPKGFGKSDTLAWDRYVAREGVVARLEAGCGRMQNRLVVFADGTRACARYRQNTDQIQGELFSFFLGQLLNISNLAPSAATVIDTASSTWSTALGDITQAQWKEQRPVVLTRWLPDLEPAGIPQPFQPLERHLNKYDVWNITLDAAASAKMQAKEGEHEQRVVGGNNVDNKPDDTILLQQQQHQQQGLRKRLETARSQTHAHQSRMLDSSTSVSAIASAPAPASAPTSASASASASPVRSDKGEEAIVTSLPVLRRLIELAQWSDLIVFDYLIANLDRVVNNLYNFQWNADIMAAPAHNLARQVNSQLLVFLDNESGLLHGYRLLKKYEAYHSLLLDNLCVFRQPTIEALQRLRADGAGRRLRELFEQTTNADVRDVLPSLPDKSIKILVDRIDRVLGQVQKCRDLLADR